MKKLRAAVVGVGYLGRFHAQKYAALSNDAEFIGVCDLNSEQSAKVAAELKCASFSKLEDLIGKIDIATIATTTTTHFEVAKFLLSAGIHVLVEKPLTTTSQRGQELEKLAHQKGCVLQVGHIERFNPAFRELTSRVKSTPDVFEAFRLAPFKPRALDVDVVADLMIHDIDLMMSVMREPIVSIHASGHSILTKTLDRAQAEFVFASGRRGVISVNRCYPHAVRTVSVYSKQEHAFADLGQGTVTMIRANQSDLTLAGAVNQETIQVEKKDAMLEEVRSFIGCVRGQQECAVPAADGISALQIMERVLAHIKS